MLFNREQYYDRSDCISHTRLTRLVGVSPLVLREVKPFARYVTQRLNTIEKDFTKEGTSVSTLQNKFMDGSGEIDNGEALRKAQKNNTVSSIYKNGFFNMLHVEALRSALHIVPQVLEFIQPTSVIDVGCGTGDFLAV